MILKDHANKLETNVRNETQNFGIGNASVVIDILRNRMYKHKIQTMVQEYISNARDAHREIGKVDNNFTVTIPTELNPVFKVRDFGPGITPDRMANVFIMYGASTKRDSNTQTGGFGLGAKSAWSYTDSFTITTYVDGIRRSYVAHTGVSNNGRLDLISTDTVIGEKNGTEIQVAVQRNDVREFRDAVFRATYFWKEKPVVKGHLDMPTLVEGLKIGNDFEAIEGRLIPDYIEGRQSYGFGNGPLIVIDSIPYSVDSKLLAKCPTLNKLTSFVRRKVVLYIDNGVVEVSASREEIADSDKTKAALEKLATKVFMEIKTQIAKEFGGVANTGEYISVYQKLNSAFNVESGFAKYKDYLIERGFIRSESFKKVKITKIHCLSRYGGNRISKITKEELVNKEGTIRQGEIPLDDFNNLYFLNSNESLITQNKRIRDHFDKGSSKVYLIEILPGNEKEFKKLISELNIKDFQSLTFVVLPKEAKVKVSRDKTEFCAHVVDGGRHRYLTLADNEQKWLYFTIDKAGIWEYESSLLKPLNDFLDANYNLKVCGLAGKALEMVKDDENFKPLKEWLDKFKATKVELNHMKVTSAKSKDVLDNLSEVTGIQDKKLAAMIKEYKEFANSKVEDFPGLLVDVMKNNKEWKQFVLEDGLMHQKLKDKYSLLYSLGGSYYAKREAQEFVAYVNAKFRGSK